MNRSKWNINKVEAKATKFGTGTHITLPKTWLKKRSGCSNQRYVGGITAEMKRILDIDKILEDKEKEKQKTYWQRIKNDPVKFGHYKEWRKQYVNKKKEKEARALSPSPIAAVPFEKANSRENIISQITDLMCRVEWQDHELRNVWTALENLRSLLPAAGAA